MTRPGDPLTRQRSAWEPFDAATVDTIRGLITAAGGDDFTAWRRRVHDGVLEAFASHEPIGWHLSVCHHAENDRRAPRYPTWDEIADARYRLLPGDLDMVMHLPPPAEFVAVHETTFHLYEVEP